MSGLGTEIERIVPRAFKRKGCGCAAFAQQLDTLGVVAISGAKDMVVARLVSEANARWYLRWIPDRWLNRAAVFVFERARRKAGMDLPMSSDAKLAPTMLRPCRPTCPTDFIGGNAIVSISVGHKSKQIQAYTWPRLQAYAKRVGAVFVGLEKDMCPVYPIGNKWILEQVCARYDRMLFVDSDIWIHDELPNVFETFQTGAIYAHEDRSELKQFHSIDIDREVIKDTQKIDPPSELKILNTGFVLMDREHANAWRRPQKPFHGTHTFEQTLFEVRARLAGHKLRPLPIEYNLQWWMKNQWGKRSAWVFHLANMPHSERIAWLQGRQALIHHSNTSMLAMPVTNGEPVTELVLVSSLASNQEARQLKCLQTWKDFGFEVAIVNSADEIDRFKQIYKTVDHWIPGDAKTGQPPKVKTLAMLACEFQKPVMVVNSDIETYGNKSAIVDRMDRSALVAGIRWNYRGNGYTHATRERWGIDAFLFDQPMAESLPELGFRIGKPVWDYWVPHHFKELGYSMQFIADRLFFHELHQLRWSRAEWEVGSEWLQQHYGIKLSFGSSEFRSSLPYFYGE